MSHSDHCLQQYYHNHQEAWKTLIIQNKNGGILYGFRSKPEKLHNREDPDGHDDGDDDDLVHVGEAHHDEISVTCVIMDLYHPPLSRPLQPLSLSVSAHN